MFRSWLVLLSTVGALVLLGGSARAAAPAAARRWTLPVLMYHKIAVQGPPSALRVPPQAFARQMAYLACAGYHPVRLSHWWAHVRDGASLPPKPIAITFDDGYEDNWTNALPVLRRHGFPATVFVIAGKLGQTVRWPHERGHPSARLLTPEQVRTLARLGVEIGSHTLTHPDLRTLAAGRLARELADSRRVLERLTGRPVRVLAYPFGAYDQRVVAAVRRAGYRVAVTTTAGVNTERTDLLTLRRIRVRGTDGLETFAHNLSRAAVSSGDACLAWNGRGS
ncbi:MAG: polysaccharide deacetylase family protein [Clostridia bacterium]|nr:polysaccharide deacetylase family protein [Clostridia bacterium]